MLKKIISGAIICLPLSVLAQKSVSPAAQLTEMLQAIKTLKANFVQHTYDVNKQLLQTSQGNMQLMRPGKFRWETKTPAHQIVVTNGQWLWIYDVDLMQVTKQPVSRSQMSIARVLSGDTAALLAKFAVSVLSEKQGREFVLVPKKQSEAFRQISLLFSHQQLAFISVLNQLNQKNTFSLTNLQVNHQISTKVFDFVPPKGVEVLQS